MKRFIYILTTSLAMTMLLLNISSCTTDECVECSMNSNDLTIQLSFAKSGSQHEQTRATEPSDHDGSFNEQKIETLNAFFYEGNILKWKVSSSNLSYDEGSNVTTLPIPADKAALFDGNTTTMYDIYVVANNKADITTITEGNSNLQALKDLVLQSSEFVSKGGETAQTNFVMDGAISKVVNINSPDLGTIDLKRAASKIRLRVTEVNIPDYTQEGDMQARLVHFTDQSALMEEGVAPTPSESDWKNTGSKTVSTTALAELGGGSTTAAPFYAYANNWQDDANRETYIELYVPLKHNGETETHTYKYYIPVTPQNLTGEEAQYMNRLDRNYIYDIGVIVRILGSIEEPPVQLEGNYIVKDWNTQEVLVDIKGAHYFVVSERNVMMPNIDSYMLNYNSSVANVTLVPNSLKATYTYVPAGASAPVTENVTSAQMPTITVQPNVSAGTITINSPIPVNYIPKDIEFEVTNGAFTETVTLRQVPATYFTTTKGVKSSQYDQNPLTNPYMYAITTLAPDGNTIWGFPPTDALGQTVNNEEVSKMVSPKFEMASQFGASLPKSYSAAQTQCRNYWEDTEGGVRKSNWRLPTAAEIKYIDDLQHDSNVAVGMVMTGNYYWSSWSLYPTLNYNNTVYGAYKMKSPTSSPSSYNSAATRCIRDIKD